MYVCIYTTLLVFLLTIKYDLFITKLVNFFFYISRLSVLSMFQVFQSLQNS